ncbi:MAG: hypothetical protein F6K56_06805 [Moorea sp. SIO3G5]|nr:hypothetical protein [Moorena sp. SIO3G5]
MAFRPRYANNLGLSATLREQPTVNLGLSATLREQPTVNLQKKSNQSPIYRSV